MFKIGLISAGMDVALDRIAWHRMGYGVLAWVEIGGVVRLVLSLEEDKS